MVRIMQVWLKGYDAPVEFTTWDDEDGVHRIATGCPSGFMEEILKMHPDPPQVEESLYVHSRRVDAPEGEWWEGMWGTVDRIEVLNPDPTVPTVVSLRSLLSPTANVASQNSLLSPTANVASDPDPLELIHKTYPS